MKRKTMVCFMAAAIVTLSGCSSAKAEETGITVTTQTQSTVLPEENSAPPEKAEMKNQSFVLARVIEVKESESELVIEKGEMNVPERPEGDKQTQMPPDSNQTEEQNNNSQPRPEGEKVPNLPADAERPDGEKGQGRGGFGSTEVTWSGEEESLKLPSECKITIRQGKEQLEGAITDIQTGNTIRLVYTVDDSQQETLTGIEIDQMGTEPEQKADVVE